MCGIFGYFCRSQVSMQKVLELLQRLETNQYKDEASRVGGHGAGVNFLDDSGKMVVHKVGKTNGLPAKDLSEIVEVAKAKSRIVLGHVRRASDKFKQTVKYSEVTQPYKVNCLGLFEIISTHNGFVKNYEAIKDRLTKDHHYESEKRGFVDSEVIPHLFEESLMQHNDEVEARKEIFETIRGDNTVVLLSMIKYSRFLHVLHKGRTRGIHVWKNGNGEIILCSREEPLQQVFGDLLEQGNFKEVLSVRWEEDRKEQRTYKIVCLNSLMSEEE